VSIQEQGIDQVDQAMMAVRKLKEKVALMSSRQHAPIAVTGIAMRLPGPEAGDDIKTLAELDAMLRSATDAVTDVPTQRWPSELYDADPDAIGRTHFREGGFLTDPGRFDPKFFGISPREAKFIDPQQRMLLQVAWEAFEDAGMVTQELAGSRTGVFVGANSSDYLQMQLNDPSTIDTYSLVGGSLSIIANRLSYQLDLRGPSMTIDTACSSSLVALHAAVRSLRSGECNVALAAGASLILSPEVNVAHSKGLPLAPGGRCRTFDEGAEGYTRGEGVVALILRLDDDAMNRRDRRHALILSSAVNQDGRSNGLTAPNSASQQDCIADAIRDAGISMAEVEFVEAHGTGTALGDPIEVEALVETYGEVQGNELLVGSLKSNIGHLEAAAGLAGVAKAIAAVKKGYRYQSLHVDRVSPLLPLDGSRIKVATAETAGAWTSNTQRRVAAVSAFGAGGTNAHAIVAEADAAGKFGIPIEKTAPLEYLMISAANRTSLQELARRYAMEIKLRPNDLAAIATTTFHRRTWLKHRLVTPAGDPALLVKALSAYADGDDEICVSEGRSEAAGKTVFVVPGQGPHWRGMGADMYQNNNAFRAAIDEVDKEIQLHAGFSVRELLCVESEEQFPIEQVQPSLFAMSIGLASAWQAAGLVIDAVVGHSMGEAAAAYLCGALSLADASRVICGRARALSRIAGQGRMLLVGDDSDHLKVEIESFAGVGIAVINGPRSTVLSGDALELAEIEVRLRERNVFTQFVDVDVASHSPQIETLKDEILDVLADIKTRIASTRWESTVRGRAMESEVDVAYWYANMRQPVQFCTAVENLIDDGYDFFIELSPHPTLVGAIEQIVDNRSVVVIGSHSRGEHGHRGFQTSVGSLWTHFADGGPLSPTRKPVPMVDLPVYPFDEQVLWFTEERGIAPWQGDSSSKTENLSSSSRDDQSVLLVNGMDAASSKDVRNVVVDIVCNTLGMKPQELDTELGFFAQGMDSMMGRRAALALSTQLKVELPTRALFDYPCVDDLAAYLESTASANSTEPVKALTHPPEIKITKPTKSNSDDLIRALERELVAREQG